MTTWDRYFIYFLLIAAVSFIHDANKKLDGIEKHLTKIESQINHPYNFNTNEVSRLKELCK